MRTGSDEVLTLVSITDDHMLEENTSERRRGHGR
jgi:hypothetical protein